MTGSQHLVEAVHLSKRFGHVDALRDVSLSVDIGKVTCLLGDNGAGKSTAIKILSGVYQPDAGEVRIGGRPARLTSPRAALDNGIATVFQDLAMIPIMPVVRNFFLGREPTKWWGPFRRIDHARAAKVTQRELGRIGIRLRDPNQVVGTLSGGERQAVAIARAIHFGANVLILDEPTSALGVREAAIVLRYIGQARSQGLGILLITHNARHAYSIGDSFTVLNHGSCVGTFKKGEISRDQLYGLMAGGDETDELLSAPAEEDPSFSLDGIKP